MNHMKKRAFTLIELTVTATIIMVLSGIVLANYEKSKVKSRDTQRKTNLSQYAQALESYKVDNKKYLYCANCVNGLDVTSAGQTEFPKKSDSNTKLSIGGYLVDQGYMTVVPSDPKTNTMTYRTDANGSEFKIFVPSESIKSTDTGNCTTGTVESKAGDFCDPHVKTQLQISSSDTAATTW